MLHVYIYIHTHHAPRTLGSILSSLCSKAVKRSLQSKTPLTKQTVNAISSALSVAKDHTLDVPGGIQAIATYFIS